MNRANSWMRPYDLCSKRNCVKQMPRWFADVPSPSLVLVKEHSGMPVTDKRMDRIPILPADWKTGSIP